MIHPIIEKVSDHIRENTDWVFRIRKQSDGSILQIRVLGEDGDNARLSLFCMNAEEEFLHLHLCVEKPFEADQVEKLLPVLNDVNHERQYMKFVLDKSRRLTVLADFFWSEEFMQKHLCKMIMRCISVMDMVYEELQKEIGADA